MSKLSFAQQCEQDWSAILQSLFPTVIPDKAEWSHRDDILSVLSLIGKYGQSNHTFFPDGGGMDLEGAKPSNEADAIELDFGLIYLAKISKIEFNGFKNNSIWNYFRFEVDPISQTGINKGSEHSEEVTELEPGHYVHRSAWDEKEYDGKPLPKGARHITRLLKGAFVIFSKDSIYNHSNSTYDGRHNKMTSAEFRAYIEKQL